MNERVVEKGILTLSSVIGKSDFDINFEEERFALNAVNDARVSATPIQTACLDAEETEKEVIVTPSGTSSLNAAIVEDQ